MMEIVSRMLLGYSGESIPGLDTRKLKLIADDRGQYSFMARELDVTKDEWEVVKSWYDGEILYLDSCIGELVGFLRSEGIFENTLLILTSDHGESFGEHGLASHQFGLYDNLIHVPLILVYPDIIPRRRRIPSLVSHVDIFPTILDLLNIKRYRRGIPGRSLSPFEDRRIHDYVCAECGESVRSRLVGHHSLLSSKLKPYDMGYKCLRTSLYKYVISADRKEQLYNIKQDPSEKTNIAREHPDKTESFRKQLENTIDISFFGPKEFPATKDRDEILKKLRLLGYI